MKKLLSIFLALILVVIQVPNISKASEFDHEKPRIIITSSNSYSVKSGEYVSVKVNIKNNSRYAWAEDIIGSLGNDSSGLVYVEGSSYDTVRTLEAGRTSSLSFRVRVDEEAEGRNYSLPLKITYYDYDSGEEQPAITDNINIIVKNEKLSPQIQVKKVDILPSNNVSPGDVIAVGFSLENIGSDSSKDLRISLDGLSNDGFSLLSGVNDRLVQVLEPGESKYVYFELKSSPKLAKGSHELNLVMSYKDSKGKSVVDREKSNFFINTKASDKGASNIIIENLQTPSGTIGVNKDVDISFSIRNQGQSPARNIRVEAISEDQSGLVPKTVSTVKINSLEKGESRDLNFKFLSTSGATTKNHPIEILISYEDDFEEKTSINQFIGVFINNPEKVDDDGTKDKPKLIIDKYNFDPQLVKAGENFEMTLSFFNTNSTKTVKNIKIFLTAEAGGTNPDSPSAGGSVFTPVDSSNTFYIDSIPPKGRVEKTITMFTVPDALARTHTIVAHFEYEDNMGNPVDDTERIGVPVVQQSRLETGEIGFYPEAYVGQPMPVSLEFYNTGKVTLYNMMVKLEGDFQTENGSYYVGNFASGSSEYFEGMVIPQMEGELVGAVVFSYEDSTGQMQEVRKDFSLNVMDMPAYEEYPDDFYPPMEENSGGIKALLKSKGLWIGLAVIGLGIGGIIFYKKRKRKKEEEELALDE